MNIKPFPVAVVGLGPGSQPEDPDLAYMPLPREIDSFDQPTLPTSEEVEHLHAAKQVIAELITQLQGYQGDAESYPVQDISQLDTANRQLINQLLGEGEVSCRVKLLDGRELDMQESVFAGVWRVLESSADGQLLADRIEACPIPSAVWQAAQAFGRPQLDIPTLPAQLMNAGPVLTEIAAAMQHPGDEAHIINFSLLPMSPQDMDCLDAILGPGNSGVFSRGYGKCRVMATSLRNVWRVQYFNGMNAILLDTLEITRIPEVALASTDDLADSLDRLQEAWQWLQGEY
ncbi:hydrogenase expression/formation protein [Aquitalea palustris]|uniref:Hydrogenase expression/formation protein n=1 Tax=Aquitalea palustris TaxID=2480983 RepID=A0A454JGK6_9NEIS|nr:hydrogenase expression/formation protein [Aquitalea palustris]RMC95587.1 hydrogenase expression/formation protein [Aquitalea palustris]